MYREEYMKELRRRLNRLPDEELYNVLGYYTEYFDEAGADREEDVIKELGLPANVASQILADYAIKDMGITSGTPKKGISKAWFMILAIFAAPIALPLAIATLALIFAMIITVVALIFTFAMVTVSLIIAGFATGFAGISVMFQHTPTAIMFIGIGTIAIGLGIIFAMLVRALTTKGFKGVVNVANNLLNGLKSKREGKQ